MESSPSLTAQEKMQKNVEKLYQMISLDLKTSTYKNFVILDNEGHTDYASNALISLPRGVSSLCSGQPWLMYWNLNALNILNFELPIEIKEQIVKLISECKCSKTGAFSGGPFQLAHLAPTYASLAALISLNTPSGYALIDRESIHSFILARKSATQPGAFTMHDNGESDMRAIYCAVSVASILNILTDEIRKDVSTHIANCQNYDGGFSAEPFGESHGGYTYCAIASLALLGEADKVDCRSALEWCVMRQMDFEGGFNGRPNKIVDSCYTFWIGASIVILKRLLGIADEVEMCRAQALQAYVLVASQSTEGFFDKPGSAPDFYHTAYALSGLSYFQNPKLFKETKLELQDVDPLINAVSKNVRDARKYFESLA